MSRKVAHLPAAVTARVVLVHYYRIDPVIIVDPHGGLTTVMTTVHVFNARADGRTLTRLCGLPDGGER